MVFTRKNKEYQQYNIKMNGVSIPHSPSVMYLGVLLDRKIRWQDHIRSKIGKAKKLLMTIAQATRNIWGPSPKMMRWAYVGIVRPVLTYAALIWGHELGHAGITKALNQLNRLALSTLASMHGSTPSRAAELITDTTPLATHTSYCFSYLR